VLLRSRALTGGSRMVPVKSPGGARLRAVSGLTHVSRLVCCDWGGEEGALGSARLGL
jgi:hypothetical protein